MTAEEARKIANKVEAQKRAKSWNLLDTLQLAWFKMWIKYHAKRGEKRMSSVFTGRHLVIKVLESKKYEVRNYGFCVIQW